MSDENNVSSSTVDDPLFDQHLIVRMPFPTCRGKSRTRKRISRTTAKLRRELKQKT